MSDYPLVPSCLAGTLFCAMPARAQGVQTAIVTGSATSADGVALPGVTVTAASSALLGERLTLGPAAELAGGRYRLGDAPGHGFEIDPDAVARAHERWQRDGAYNTVESVQ